MKISSWLQFKSSSIIYYESTQPLPFHIFVKLKFWICKRENKNSYCTSSFVIGMEGGNKKINVFYTLHNHNNSLFVLMHFIIKNFFKNFISFLMWMTSYKNIRINAFLKSICIEMRVDTLILCAFVQSYTS